MAEAWLGLRQVAPTGDITIVRAEVLRAGRPGLLDIVAQVGRPAGPPRRRACAAWPTSSTSCARARRPRSACSTTRTGSPCAPTRCATRSWRRCCWPRSAACRTRPGPVAVCATTTTPRCSTAATAATSWSSRGSPTAPRPDVDLMVALEEAGFNHVAAPLVRWVWEGRDLGVVQEPLADRSGGWALALTSLRDFYASGGSPEAAGGDFGAEARALGTMTARMHLALDRAFLRHHEPVADWVDEAEAAIAAADASAARGTRASPTCVKWLREAEARLPGHPHPRRPPARAHGTHRPGLGGQRLRPRAACWPAARHRVAARRWPTWPTCCGRCTEASVAAAAERDPAGRLGLASLGQAWETRNRRAFMTGYLGTPGISGLVGPDRDLVRRLVSFLELARSVRATTA